MATKVEFHPLFWRDVEAHATYLQEEAELGEDFLYKVEQAIESIKLRPETHPRLYGEVRHIILERYRRHVIHYEPVVSENLVRIYALYHAHENPAKWIERLM